ncbi:hypothetical protein HK100_010429 [Physocladia obscura]|uniref:Uncharacterized protein n=1 Tax=Physocladia obscura TaxID=109957 RepID=A0AAD5T530_9FUNG|nr:hypothetical protein HK100_010429 [Physocladia obscura]
MAPPLQTALVGLLLGVFGTDLALGAYHVAPFVRAAFGNAALLKSKIVGSQRAEILSVHRAILAAPVWFWAGLVGAWALLVGVSLFNAATDKKQTRVSHVATFVCAIACAIPPLLKRASPVLWLRVTSGRAKLSATEELAALYDIGFVVAIDAALLGLAFLVNLTIDQDADGASPSPAPPQKNQTHGGKNEDAKKLQ